MQFITTAIKSLFGTGANISLVRDKNENSVFSGIVLGIITGTIIFGIIIANIEKYITFMNMDIETYKVFAIYAIIQIFLQLILNLALSKMYFENKNKRANKYSILFNLINFSTLILTSLLTKNQIIISSISIICTSIFVIIMLIRVVEKTKIQINITNCIKYDSVNLFASISMFIIYLFGFKNAFDFGEKFALAISFATLITDTQWDVAHSIATIAQIDIAKREYSNKKYLLDSYKLIILLVLSTFIMGIILYPNYNVDILITTIIATNELICLCLYPLYITRLMYIQLEHSAVQATLSKQIANILRTLCSFIISPYCTAIGLAISVLYQLISTKYIIVKNNINMEMLNEKISN
ncbi:MAG: hypothetical protein IJE05_01475 [Clostridia bacterium]|nr:hypothetical protein [Clostridia bacterium]